MGFIYIPYRDVENEECKEIRSFLYRWVFEKDYAIDALNSGFRLTFLDTFSYYNIGRKSWESKENKMLIQKIILINFLQIMM